MKNLFLRKILPIYRRSAEGLPLFRRRIRKRLVIPSSALLFASGFFSCGTVHVYHEPNQPVFRSDEAQPAVAQTGSLNVITFNIKKAEKIQLAGSELEQFRDTTNVDIYLLQEMDEKGVASIAKRLGVSYLYIPIVYNTSLKKNIGNAILTRGTIAHPQKLLLPHAKWLSKSRRQVTIAEVTIDEKKVMVYSVHTETVVMGRKKRMEQLDAIIEHANMQLSNYKYILIGGDFNTLFTKDAELAVEKFSGNGFDWSSAAAGNTANAFFGLVKPRHDYIFSKGLNVTDSYKIEASQSSDHYPIFATFRFQNEQQITAKQPAAAGVSVK